MAGTYKAYPVELVGELEALLAEKSAPPPDEGRRDTEMRNSRLSRCLSDLDRYGQLAEGDAVLGATVTQLVDSGRFGRVWKANLRTGEVVAVKAIHRSVIETGRMMREFRQGVSAMRKLSEASPPDSVVRLLDTDSSQLVFTMTFVPGGDLRDLASRGWHLDKKLKVFRGVCEAVEFAHRNGVVHRDVRPANILIDTDANDAPVLTDFDLADLEGMQTMTTRSIGALPYAAPENLQQRDQKLCRLREGDIYSLGRLLIYMVTEKDPESLYLDPVPPLPELDAHPGLQRIVRRCTLRDPERRYPSVASLLDDLARHDSMPKEVGTGLNQTVTEHRVSPVPPQPVPPASQHTLFGGSTIASAVATSLGPLLGVVAGYWLSRGRQSSDKPKLDERRMSHARVRPWSLTSKLTAWGVAAAVLGPIGGVAVDHLLSKRQEPRDTASTPETPRNTRNATSNTAELGAVAAAARPDAQTEPTPPPQECPSSCCAGAPCDAPHRSCEERWQCQLCSDQALGRQRNWQLRLMGVELANPHFWSDVEVCVVPGTVSDYRTNCVRDFGPIKGPQRLFDFPPADKTLGHYVKVIGREKSGRLSRIAQKHITLKVGPQAICEGFALGGFETRNGNVKRVSLRLMEVR